MIGLTEAALFRPAALPHSHISFLLSHLQVIELALLVEIYFIVTLGEDRMYKIIASRAQPVLVLNREEHD